MTISLERVVRPFQTNDITPARRAATIANPEDAENLVLAFGLNGTGKSMSGNYSWTATKYMDRRYNEWFKANAFI